MNYCLSLSSLEASLKESEEMLITGASAELALDLEGPTPCALAMTTAKYGRKTAPATKTMVIQPAGTATARTMQITLITMATVYFMKRLRRSISGDTSREVTD